MKMKYLLCSIGLCLLIYGCSESYMPFSGTDRIQFETKTEEVYTFAYFPESKQTDTLTIPIVTVGEIVDRPRKFRFEQVTKEWEYVYDEEDSKKVVDSNYVDMKFPAVKGVHFEAFGQGDELVLPANQNVLDLKVILRRDGPGLEQNAHKLVIRLLPSADFETGETSRLIKSITISDKLERPTRWKDDSYYYALFLGNWSERKHRFMIDVTKQKWDNAFLLYIINSYDTRALRDYYLAKLKQALADFNADPKNDPPMKDENNNEVVFP